MTKKIIFINLILVLALLIVSPRLNVDINLNSIFMDFSKEHFFGTDDLGRDIFSLIVVGGFRTLEVVVVATGISFFVGTFLGMTAGYFENTLSLIIKSIVDLMMIVPTLVVALIITSIFGINPITAGVSLGLFSIVLLGVPWYVVLYRRILKNILPALLVNLGNTASGVILQYSALTFIGLGSDYTKPDWGAMLYQYRIYLVKKPSLIILPTLCILWVSLSFNLIFDNKEQKK